MTLSSFLRGSGRIFGAILFPASKKDGVIRTIAVGTILHKLISSSLMNYIKDRLPWYFSPVQFGVGASGRAENIVHGIRNILLLDNSKVVVSLDLENAFNSFSRDVVIGQVAEHFNTLTKWVWYVYGHHSDLIVRGGENRIISSQSGVRQGDPMGPFLFCLALQPAMLVIKDKVDSLTYMDDIYLVGTEKNMVDAFYTLKDYLKVLYLKINYKKCWMSKKVPGLPKEIKVNDHLTVMKLPLDYTQQIEGLPAKVKTQIDAITK